MSLWTRPRGPAPVYRAQKLPKTLAEQRRESDRRLLSPSETDDATMRETQVRRLCTPQLLPPRMWHLPCSQHHFQCGANGTRPVQQFCTHQWSAPLFQCRSEESTFTLKNAQKKNQELHRRTRERVPKALNKNMFQKSSPNRTKSSSTPQATQTQKGACQAQGGTRR